MKNSLKRTLAREFLIIVLTFVLALAAFLCTFPYNSILRKQLDEIDKQIYRAQSQYYLSLKSQKQVSDPVVDFAYNQYWDYYSQNGYDKNKVQDELYGDKNMYEGALKDFYEKRYKIYPEYNNLTFDTFREIHYEKYGDPFASGSAHSSFNSLEKMNDPVVDFVYDTYRDYYSQKGYDKAKLKDYLYGNKDKYEGALKDFYENAYKVYPEYNDLTFDTFRAIHYEKYGDPFASGSTKNSKIKVFTDSFPSQVSEMSKINILEIYEELSSLNVSSKEIKSKIFTSEKRVSFGIKALIILAIILFGMRYLIYGVIWSIKTLKEK